VLLKAVPHVKDWWETLCEKKEIGESTLFVVTPTWGSFRDVIKEQYYLVGSYDDYIQNGPHCDRKGTKQCHSSSMSSMPCALSWLSKNLSNIWCSSNAVACIDISRQKWIFWTSRSWVKPIDMLSKSSRSLNKRCCSLGLQNPHNKRREKEAPTYRTKVRARMDNLRETILNRK
jgi:hypothetical protein